MIPTTLCLSQGMFHEAFNVLKSAWHVDSECDAAGRVSDHVRCNGSS